MNCDDDITYFIGAELWDIDLKDVERGESRCDDVDDIQFLEIKTSRGVFTIANHNVHNGFYGGWWLKAEKL